MKKKKIKILHVAQAAGGVDRYIRMLLKYLDKDKFENVLVCSQDFHKESLNKKQSNAFSLVYTKIFPPCGFVDFVPSSKKLSNTVTAISAPYCIISLWSASIISSFR